MTSCIAADEGDEEGSEEEADPVYDPFALNPLHPVAAQAAFLDPGFDLDELGLHELDPDDDVGLYDEEEDEMMSDDEDVPLDDWDGADLGDLIHEDDYHANLHEFQVRPPWSKWGASAWHLAYQSLLRQMLKCRLPIMQTKFQTRLFKISCYHAPHTLVQELATAAYPTRHLSQETAAVFVTHLRLVPACVTAADSQYVRYAAKGPTSTGVVGSQRVPINS